MNTNVAIVGGGLTGMSAADVLSQNGCRCTVFERDETVGGLAGSFLVNGVCVEKFYHHLFTSDTVIADLIARLGLGDKLEWLPTSNSFFANRIYRLSTPFDLLRFAHLNLIDRLRLGLLYLSTRLVRRWQSLEAITAREWLIRMAGQNVYAKVWQPLLRNKFGRYADEVAAVWIWNKLKLRGSSRGKAQEERLGYLREGFGQAVDAFERLLRAQGVQIKLDAAVERVQIENGRATGVVVNGELHPFDRVLVTIAPELFLQIAPDLPENYCTRLSNIKYLANVCLVMSLDRSLSDTYWLNVGDPAIPFTGVIEHTNMQRPETYGGAHLAYLSRYMDPEDPYYAMSPSELLDAYLPHLKKMFRGFERAWVKELWAWRERYTQPLIGLNYSQIKPPFQTPVENLWLSCMAQVYPQDRGMNYAVVYGQRVAQAMLGQDGQHAQ
ncbi:MAG: NAD(P)/FAD-dependent oxidoreductase [Anaerolineae bacterium]|nr:NAD(P)/FAD-dependent oxidoreductase [Anaerolineae bacterium]